MCVVKTPKVKTTPEKEKQPIVIRNPYLDGEGPEAKALRKGRSSLRIERAGSGGVSTPPPAQAPRPTSPSSAPPIAFPRPITGIPYINVGSSAFGR